MVKRVEKIEEEEGSMSAPITLPPLDTQMLAQLQRRYDETSEAETRTRYQMILLAQRGYTTPQIARVVLRSEDTVHVLKRFSPGELADVETHFDKFAQTPGDLLRHLGSPFAPDIRPAQSQASAA